MNETKTSEFVTRRRESTAKEKYPKRLLVNTAVCAGLALGILCLSAVDSEVTGTVANGISKAVSSELILDEDLGRLHFVDASLPVADGEVAAVFAENGRDVRISGAAAAEVMAVLSGIVAETGEDSIVISNDNGTRSIYTGVVPQVSAGERVEEHGVIGTLAEDSLVLETVGGAGFVDPLSEKELTETMR